MPRSDPQYVLFTRLLRRRGIYHFLFWLCYFSTAALIIINVRQVHDWTFFLKLLTLLPPDMLQVYLNIYILIPHLLFRKRYFLYFSTLLVSILLQSALFIWLHRYYTLSGETAFAHAMDITPANLAIQGLNILSLVGLTTGIKFLKDWIVHEQQWQEKERQHIQTELNFLKSQIHPHFFFNTLNNLYSLTVKKSDQAPEIVLKLSDLMSYILYDSNAATVPLDKEIITLENYVALEQLRYGRRLTLHFEKRGDAGSVQIPPLLLLALVENGFKHGLKDHMGPVRIDLSLNIQPPWLDFEVCNPALIDPKENGQGGIGLKNVTRRLDILYGSRYTLHLQKIDDTFKAHLKIPLS